MKDLTTFDLETKKRILFKGYFMRESDAEYESLENELFECSDIPEMIELMKVSLIARSSVEIQNKINAEKHLYADLYIEYNHLLNKAAKLARELKITSSLEYANLFTFLLWNGYFSKSKSHVYQIENRRNIFGLFSFDIMRGGGVCLNYSDMLKDFLNKNIHFNAASIFALCPNDLKPDYRPEIERNYIKPKFYLKLLFWLLKGVVKRSGNHAVTLVQEINKTYLYDATNLCAYDIDGLSKAHIISGTGSLDLHPYLSYLFSTDGKERVALESLINETYSPYLYTAEDFKAISEKNMAQFKDNNSLIEDFYTAAYPHLEKIATGIERKRKNINVK